MRRRVLTIGVLWVALHVYVALRLLAHVGLAPWATALAGGLLFLLAAAPFAALAVMRRESTRFGTAVHWIGFTALGLSSLLISLVGVADLARVHTWGIAGAVTSAAIMGTALVLTGVGIWRARRPRVVRVAVPIAGLPPDLDRFRIVQLSDLHVGPTIKRPFVAAVVETANRLAPDLVALTGDLADGPVRALQRDVAPLRDLRAPHGKCFVSGNHDYYWDPLGWLAELDALGFNVLTNTHRLLRQGAGRILLAGVTDASASHRLPGHASDPRGAIAGAPPSDVKILLAHQPVTALAAREVGFDLQLSGHTHGGQYFPFNLLVRLFQPFVAGLHRLEQMWLYVSRGTGYWGPPLRLGAPAEITLIELRATP